MSRSGQRLVWLTVALMAASVPAAIAAADPVQVGSKKFTESVILGELATRLLQDGGTAAVHRRELGGTRVLWSALLKGDIDVYPEYTGTLIREILTGERIDSPDALRAVLAGRGIGMTAPLGFDNTYVIALTRDRARELGIRRISDLRNHPDLRLGFGNEFMDREDGWRGLRDAYRLPQQRVRGMDHDLAYRGLAGGAIDAMDAYSTDASIRRYGLALLEDDLGYFPEYKAVLLYRADLAIRHPQAVMSLEMLSGAIDAPAMTAMNASVRLNGRAESRVATEFLRQHLGLTADARGHGRWDEFLRYTREHLILVAISLSAAIAVAIPLGVFAAHRPRLGQVILSVAGVVQTIPSLALLVFMIPLLGIGGPPAIVALFLYSLLPIIRNTTTGIRDISLPIRESAEALGLPPFARLRLIELPMAMPTILAGIKTAAVINVGTATLGALIGAGGYGQPILTGIRLDDTGLILMGAVPAAALALAVQGLFELAERYLVPRGLRLSRR